jgi:ketosteroid isomerase-like protein
MQRQKRATANDGDILANTFAAREVTMKKTLGGEPATPNLVDRSTFHAEPEYHDFEALNPFFQVVLRGLSELVDGKHFFDTFAEDAIFESRYRFPGWPQTIQGRANLMASLSGYGKTIMLHSGDALVVHRSEGNRVVILEYEVHGKILSSGAPYDNRLISVVTIEGRKIVHWRDYMDSLAAWTALNGSRGQTT